MPEETDIFKVIATFTIIAFLLLGAQFATRSFPQDILLDNNSIFQVGSDIIAFQSTSTTSSNVLIANQVQQVNNNDIIPLSNGASIQITGNQVQGDFISGIFAIPTRLSHIILFEGNTFTVPTKAETVLKNTNSSLTVTQISQDVFKLTSNEMSYNIEMPEDKTTYITDADNFILYKIHRSQNNFEITPVGIYESDFEVTITTEE